jgi:hypothetical protein
MKVEPENRNTGRMPQGASTRGRRFRLQQLIAGQPELLRSGFLAAGALQPDETIEWVAPTAADDWAEYRDGSFLERIGCEYLLSRLSHFWPAGGPLWDALGKGPRRSVFLLEANSHVSEMDSNCHAAAGSRHLVQQSLGQARMAFGARADADWMTGYFQYASRLAHLHFLRRNGVPAWLAFVYFTNDHDFTGPQTTAGWRDDLHLVHTHLGIQSPDALPGVVHLFVDCHKLSPL